MILNSRQEKDFMIWGAGPYLATVLVAGGLERLDKKEELKAWCLILDA